MWETRDWLWINSVMLHNSLALSLDTGESGKSGFHLGLKNTVVHAAVSPSTSLKLPWLQNAASLLTWRTKKSFHPQPRKSYLTCRLYRLISEKAYDQLVHSWTARLPVMCYLESKKPWHDGSSKDLLGIFLNYVTPICSCVTSAFSALLSGLKCAHSCKMVFKNILGTSGILRSLGHNDLNWICVPASSSTPSAHPTREALDVDSTSLPRLPNKWGKGSQLVSHLSESRCRVTMSTC